MTDSYIIDQGMLGRLDPLIRLPHEDKPPAIPESFENKGKSGFLVAERQVRWRRIRCMIYLATAVTRLRILR